MIFYLSAKYTISTDRMCIIDYDGIIAIQFIMFNIQHLVI